MKKKSQIKEYRIVANVSIKKNWPHLSTCIIITKKMKKNKRSETQQSSKPWLLYQSCVRLSSMNFKFWISLNTFFCVFSPVSCQKCFLGLKNHLFPYFR